MSLEENKFRVYGKDCLPPQGEGWVLATKLSDAQAEIDLEKSISDAFELRIESYEKERQKLESQVERLREKANNLLHLHLCEMEGLQSGQPSKQDWMQAIDELSETLNNKS